MILYLDTSSLVKLYVEEHGSSKVQKMVASCEAAATSVVAYAETRAALARRYREKAFSDDEYEHLKSSFETDWPDYFVLYIIRETVSLAGDLAEKHALRGFDAIHLACAMLLNKETSGSVVFSCYDGNLEKAAELEGIAI